VDGVIADEGATPNVSSEPTSVANNIIALSEFVSDSYPLNNLSSSSIAISTEM